MKILRKNIDLDTDTIAVLLMEATLNGHGTLKPFLEKILVDYASKAKKGKPEVYKKLLAQKEKAVIRKKRRLLILRSS